jgi:hypothetical protein
MESAQTVKTEFVALEEGYKPVGTKLFDGSTQTQEECEDRCQNW